jgi:type IV secretion system protein VirD4
MSRSSQPIVASTGTRSIGKDEKLLSNVLASAQAQTHFLDSPRIRDSLSASDFAFDQLKVDPMSVYLILPADRLNTFGRWLRLLIQQAITVNARNIAHKPPKPVLFMLDEMPALGHLSMVEQAYGLMAGFGMQMWGIVQDLSQLKRIYGEGWQTFISNAGVLQYFGSRDQMTAEYFSKLCGVTTIPTLSESISVAITNAVGGSSSSRTTGTTTAHAQRSLAFPDELMTLRSDQQLLLIENGDPINAVKVRWFDDPEIKERGVDLTKLEAEAPSPQSGAHPEDSPAA